VEAVFDVPFQFFFSTMKTVKTTFLLRSVAAVAMLAAMTGCLSIPESEAEIKSRENNEQIQQYIQARNIPATKTESGMYIAITQRGGTREPKAGEILTVHYVLSRIDGGGVLDSTNSVANQPFTYSFLRQSVIFDQAVAIMKQGDRATVLLPHNLAFGASEFSNLPKYSPVRLDISLVKVRTEDETINEYLLANRLILTETLDGGVRIIKNRVNPLGTLPKTFQTLGVTYTGRFLYKNRVSKQDPRDATKTVTVFDDVFDSGSFEFGLGLRAVVEGFDAGAARFRTGESGTILFPSALGYADKGSGAVPGGSPLRFDIELTTVK
jgi:FKBP-type peptidyl-prolyl cis-trans isomerase